MWRMVLIRRAFSVCSWEECEAVVAPGLTSMQVVFGRSALKFYVQRPMMELK